MLCRFSKNQSSKNKKNPRDKRVVLALFRLFLSNNSKRIDLLLQVCHRLVTFFMCFRLSSKFRVFLRNFHAARSNLASKSRYLPSRISETEEKSRPGVYRDRHVASRKEETYSYLRRTTVLSLILVRLRECLFVPNAQRWSCTCF